MRTASQQRAEYRRPPCSAQSFRTRLRWWWHLSGDLARGDIAVHPVGTHHRYDRGTEAKSDRLHDVFEDAGISGAKGRKDRPGLDAMLKAVARREVDLVMAWSVDRLGRSLVDLLATLQELHAKEVDLYLHQQGLDTSTPSGRAMFGMMGVFAEFERAMIQERVKVGLARARAEGVRLGRPMLEDADPSRAARVRAMRAQGVGVRKIARQLGVGVGTVLRLTPAE